MKVETGSYCIDPKSLSETQKNAVNKANAIIHNNMIFDK